MSAKTIEHRDIIIELESKKNILDKSFEKISVNQKKTGTIASSILGCASFLAQGDLLSFSTIAQAGIIGSFNYLIIHSLNEICLKILNACAKNICRLTTNSIETRAKFHATLDTVTNSTTFKVAKVGINIIFSTLSTAYLSIYLTPAILFSALALGIGMIIFKTGKISNHTLASYNLRAQKSLDSEISYSKNNFFFKLGEVFKDLFFPDDIFDYFHELTSKDWDRIHVYTRAIDKYKTFLPDEEKAKIRSRLENFEPELYHKIACFSILDIIYFDLPTPTLLQSYGITKSTPVKYPPFIKPEDKEILKNIHEKYSKLSKEEKYELEKSFALNTLTLPKITCHDTNLSISPSLGREIRNLGNKLIKDPNFMHDIYWATVLSEGNESSKKANFERSLQTRIY